jgi:hypothetical protein
MANSRPGIKRALISQPNTMATTPTGLITVGSRKPSNLIISPLDELADYRDRPLRNKINFRYEVDSYQSRLRDVEWAVQYHLQAGFDIQLLKEKQGANAMSGGCFNWVNQLNGLDFDYVNTNKERYVKWIFETALEYADAITLIDASDPAGSLVPAISANPISGGNERGENFSNYAYPWYAAIEGPSGTEIFSKKEIKERSLSIRTKGTKNEYNETVVNFITVELRLRGSDATITKILNILNKDMSPSLVISEKLSATTYEKFVFPANVLTHSDSFQLGDSEDYSELMFKADLTFDQFQFAYGTANGGAGTSATVDGVDTTEAQARQGATVTLLAA